MIDGLYPEESELNKIRDWKPQDGYKELVNFVQVLWHWDD